MEEGVQLHDLSNHNERQGDGVKELRKKSKKPFTCPLFP